MLLVKMMLEFTPLLHSLFISSDIAKLAFILGPHNIDKAVP
jgi:hypothetical protein